MKRGLVIIAYSFFIFSIFLLPHVDAQAQNIPQLIKIGDDFSDPEGRYSNIGDMVIDDIDNDGFKEIVFSVAHYYISNKKPRAFQLVALDFQESPPYKILAESPLHFSNILLADIDNNPGLEIITINKDSLKAFRYDGSSLFSKEFPAFGLTHFVIFPSHEGNKILALVQEDEATITRKLVMYNFDGSLYQGFKNNVLDVQYNSIGKIAYGDLLKNFPGEEIAAIFCRSSERYCSNPLIYVFLEDGSVADNFPLIVDLGTDDAYHVRLNDLHIGDVDADGNLDVIFADARTYIDKWFYEYAREINIKVVDPRTGKYKYEKRFGKEDELTELSGSYDLALGDIDGDGKMEAILQLSYEYVDSEGKPRNPTPERSDGTWLVEGWWYLKILAYNFDTNIIDSSPIFIPRQILGVGGGTLQMMSIADVNNDGVVDIVVTIPVIEEVMLDGEKVKIRSSKLYAFNKQVDGSLKVVEGWPKDIVNTDLNLRNIDAFDQREYIVNYRWDYLEDLDNNKLVDLVIPHTLSRPPLEDDRPIENKGDQTYLYTLMNLGEYNPENGWYQPRHDSKASGMVENSVFIKKFIRGDANEDGKIDLTDAIFILNYLFKGGLEPPCLDASDVNDDGRIDISDAVYTLRYLFSGETQPPAPFQEAGIDPTEDGLKC